MVRMDLSIRMAAWRHAKGLSQAPVAKAVGVVTSAVSMWETGATRPTTDNLERYVQDGLGETMQRFYDDEALAEAEHDRKRTGKAS